MTLAICAGVPAGAADFGLPHKFYGNVTIGGFPAQNGTHITASVTGGGEDYTTLVVGEYGTGFIFDLFMVQPLGEGSTIEGGDPITFFINGIPAEVYEVGKGPWMTSYPFKDGGETNLDLRIAGTQHTISATAGTGGIISPSGSVQVPDGMCKTFTITPDSCHTILDVKVDSASVGAVSSYTFDNVIGDHSIQATFAAKTFYVTSSAGSGGSISPLGTQAVPCGGKIAFTITPANGYVIQDVRVNAVSKGPVSTYTIDPVTMNQTIVASFTTTPSNNLTINATAGPHGNITPAGNIPVAYGGTQAFTMIPDTGYSIDKILVDGSPATNAPVYTFTNVITNHTIAVSFKEGAPEYFVVSLGNGWNTFSTPVDLAAGHRQLEQIFPAGSIENIEVILGWDGTQWFIPDTVQEKEVNPLWAYYIKVKGTTTGYLYPNPEVKVGPPVPQRMLVPGPNLIGPAPDFVGCTFIEMPVKEALVSVDYEGGYTIAVSPSLPQNQDGWAVSRLGNDTQYFKPYKGYWVYMVNSGSLIGFSQTPLEC
jgi:hypothetical protein